jgi:predicted transcriptional regulator
MKNETNKMNTIETQIETNDYLNSDNKYTVITARPIEPPNETDQQPFDFSKLRESIKGKIHEKIDSFRSKSSESSESEYSEPSEVIATNESDETKQAEPATTSLTALNQTAMSETKLTVVNEEKSDEAVAKQKANNVLSKYQARKIAYWPKFKEHK